jgi:ketosteroid isomerase-like protein
LSAVEEAGGLAAIVPSVELTEESARQTIELFRTSVAAGDLSQALSLLDGDATLLDALAGEASEAVTRGELLLELRGRHSEGVTLEPVATQVTLLAGEAAFLVSGLEVFEPKEDGVLAMVGKMHETVLRIGSEGGWRIRSLHRSFLSNDAQSDSLRP